MAAMLLLFAHQQMMPISLIEYKNYARFGIMLGISLVLSSRSREQQTTANREEPDFARGLLKRSLLFLRADDA